MSSVQVSQHGTYDEFVVEFAGGLPSYTVTLQSNATFNQPTSGQPVTLQGTGGMAVEMRSISNWDTYTAATHFQPGYAYLREAQLVQNFEAVQTWGLGIAGAPCVTVSVLSSPTRLVVDVAGR